ncbi:MAG: hypothetical protein KA375_04635 [Vitreoscilla sp.]|nr:hypothetical protein [Burkholderiales bacterium]MBP6336859.1 hypothetical protein [Vitreoscilla sp.]
MGLKLQHVPATAGTRWVRQGFAECLRQPMGYASLFALFMLAITVVSVLPFIGGPLMLMAVPLLSLAYVMSASGSQQGVAVNAAVYLAPWRGAEVKQRRDLLVVCGLYAVATLVVLALCNLIDGGQFDDLLAAMAGGQAKSEEIQALMDAPGVRAGAFARVLFTALLSVPFWHAPALVVWGRQGPAQALFSSTLAVWRAKGAFLLYGLGWFVAMGGAGMLAAFLMAMLGLGALSFLLLMPLALFFTTAFYASLYYCFADSFVQDDAVVIPA